MTVQVDLQENYIRMVWRGASDNKWNLFCEAENRRLQHDRKRWDQWKEVQTVMEEPQCDKSEEELDQPDPTDQSGTLATQESIPPPSQKSTWKSKEASVITPSRRSRRVCKETQKAQESAELQKMKRRAYEREEKLT